MKIAIIGGGHIDIPFLREELSYEGFDYMIAADGGLIPLSEMHVMPDVMLGDFDSVPARIYRSFRDMQIPDYTYPERKDYTDTELAVCHAMEKIRENGGAGVIIVYGGTGTRLDHVLANISLLKQGVKAGIWMELRDENNRILLIKDRLRLQRDDRFGDYISLIPLSETVEDVCLTGFRYPLRHACMTQGNSLGISNVLEEKEGSIQIGHGYLLVIESRD